MESETKLTLTGKINGNGARDRSMYYQGTKEEIEFCIYQIERSGYTFSEKTISPVGLVEGD